MSYATAFHQSCRLLRKLKSPTRFDRAKAAKPLTERCRKYWLGGLDALWDHLEENDHFDDIHRRTRLAGKLIRKEVSDDERRLIATLLTGFHYYDDVDSVAAAIVAATSEQTFTAAAIHALATLGIRAADFELKNEGIREALMARKADAVIATRHNSEAVMETILRRFYELGENPYDAGFLADLKKELGDVTTYQAKRFALTETAIAAEYAQHETWLRNGVQRTQWNILGERTRASHQRMKGEQVAIGEKFRVASDDGSVYECLHPCDPQLPAHELVNCHCWSTPVVNDDWQIDPSKIWEGE